MYSKIVYPTVELHLPLTFTPCWQFEGNVLLKMTFLLDFELTKLSVLLVSLVKTSRPFNHEPRPLKDKSKELQQDTAFVIN